MKSLLGFLSNGNSVGVIRNSIRTLRNLTLLTLSIVPLMIRGLWSSLLVFSKDHHHLLCLNQVKEEIARPVESHNCCVVHILNGLIGSMGSSAVM